jgi:hypothetical protein
MVKQQKSCYQGQMLVMAEVLVEVLKNLRIPHSMNRWSLLKGSHLLHFRHRPVIIVHGITNNAGTFGRIQQYFLNHEYKHVEVYGTTYGDSGKTNVLFVTMQCHYIKVVS